MDEGTVLKVDRLVKKYEKFSLKDVSFNIPKGYIMGFIGQNGAGKSTTIKCIMDLVKPDSGKIEVFGMDSIKESVSIKQRLGYVSEEQYFYDDATVKWIGNFTGKFFSEWSCEQFLRLLDRFKIDGSKKIRELSKGMKMKLSLALALSREAELLILDEPTSGLDPVSRDEVLDVFLEFMQDENHSILFSSHITSDIEKIADYITVIDDGSINLSDNKDSVLSKWKMVKIENRYYDSSIAGLLTGLKKGDFGYSGITDKIDDFMLSFKKLFPEGNPVVENTSLDEFIVSILRGGKKVC